MARTINSRRKGAEGERSLAKFLREAGYEDAKRSVQYCGANGDADVIGALPGIHIECKRVERLNLDTALEQSARDARAGEIPVVVHRKNRQEWRITLKLADFLKIYGGGTNGQ